MSSKPLTDRHALTLQIKSEALRLGFFACGIAKAQAVDQDTAKAVRQWIDNGKHATMDYMRNHTDMRLDPRLLMTGLKSIVCVALNYTPAYHFPDTEYQLAAYALGQDYHDIVKSKLHQLAVSCQLTHYRAFCDSAPILERYWAVQAGLGWIGRNHQLIIPKAGSMFFLGELFTDIELDYDQPVANRCGTCRRCIEACPTGTLSEGFDAYRCLSYQTIENRGELSTQAKDKMGKMIYGCDRCQQACPWNHFSTPNNIPELQPRKELQEMTRQQWQTLSEEEYRLLFKGSAVKRGKYAGLMRNIHAISEHDKP